MWNMCNRGNELQCSILESIFEENASVSRSKCYIDVGIGGAFDPSSTKIPSEY